MAAEPRRSPTPAMKIRPSLNCQPAPQFVLCEDDRDACPGSDARVLRRHRRQQIAVAVKARPFEYYRLIRNLEPRLCNNSLQVALGRRNRNRSACLFVVEECRYIRFLRSRTHRKKTAEKRPDEYRSVARKEHLKPSVRHQ